VSINLAGIFSLLEKKVVLVDMDLRKPRLHYGFNLSNEYGASTYLIGKDTLDDIIQSSGYVNLDIITSGPIPPNPSELISSESYTQFIQELRERYDYVIVDTSPIGLVTDALPILFDSGINLYIFKANFSKKAFLENIRNLRDEHNVNDLYIVFNFAEAVAGYGVYGKYGYSYMYGYGYGYGATYGQGYIQEDDKPKGVIGRVLGLFSRKGKA
jgi:capsular exopolysaccharide synthesis family protein